MMDFAWRISLTISYKIAYFLMKLICEQNFSYCYLFLSIISWPSCLIRSNLYFSLRSPRDSLSSVDNFAILDKSYTYNYLCFMRALTPKALVFILPIARSSMVWFDMSRNMFLPTKNCVFLFLVMLEDFSPF